MVNDVIYEPTFIIFVKRINCFLINITHAASAKIPKRLYPSQNERF